MKYNTISIPSLNICVNTKHGKFSTNFVLKDRSLLFSYIKPYDIIAKSEGVLDWCCVSAEIRTYFKGTLEVKS